MSQVKVLFLALAGVVRGGPEFISSALLENSQLVWLLPDGIFVYIKYFVSLFIYIGPEKSQWGVVTRVYIYVLHLHVQCKLLQLLLTLVGSILT